MAPREIIISHPDECESLSFLVIIVIKGTDTPHLKLILLLYVVREDYYRECHPRDRIKMHPLWFIFTF